MRESATLFQPQSSIASNARIYLDTDKGSALADYIVSRCGTLEVPLNFEVPTAEFMPSTMPKYPRSYDKFYIEGGTHWPDRWVISVV